MYVPFYTYVASDLRNYLTIFMYTIRYASVYKLNDQLQWSSHYQTLVVQYE